MLGILLALLLLALFLVVLYNYNKTPEQSKSLEDPKLKQVFDYQNKIRAEVGSPPLVWSDNLQNLATNYANKMLQEDIDCGNDELCRNAVFKHNLKSGENIAYDYVFPSNVNSNTPLKLAKSWVTSEKPEYKRLGESCKTCRHYTQIIWKDTTSVGCGYATDSNTTYLVCNYDPPGNMQNYYTVNAPR